MSDVRRQDEPSMEEILASIRRIIAEDGNAAARGNTALREPEQDILDLTDRIGEDGSVISIASRLPARDIPIYAPPPADYAMAPANDSAPAPAVERVSDRPTEPKADKIGERLMSETTETASLAALAELAKSPRRDGLPADDATEAQTRELLKPMLKDWLDANLPALVERIVREEITRLTGAAK